MDGHAAKARKRPITYGKAARRQGHGKPIHLESEDELASLDEVIILKPSKPLSRNPAKGQSYKITEYAHSANSLLKYL